MASIKKIENTEKRLKDMEDRLRWQEINLGLFTEGVSIGNIKETKAENCRELKKGRNSQMEKADSLEQYVNKIHLHKPWHNHKTSILFSKHPLSMDCLKLP